jgi:hypothetical protein
MRGAENDGILKLDPIMTGEQLRKLLVLAVSRSDLEKQFAPIHPEENEPEDQENSRSVD